MSAAAKSFDEALRLVVRDPLQARGFSFDGSRTFRRAVRPGIVQIINFQLGQRSLQGRFAVNLGVYVPGEVSVNPADLRPEKAFEFQCSSRRRVRLGQLMPARLGALRAIPLVGRFFGPRDVWWRFTPDRSRTLHSMRASFSALERYGMPWLEAMTPDASPGPPPEHLPSLMR